MSHVNLKLLLQIHPRHVVWKQSARRRVRRLRPVHPDHATELWYKSELLRLVRLLSIETRRTLVPALKQLPEFAGDALPGHIKKTIEQMARKFGGIDQTAQRLADMASKKALAATDRRLAASIRDSVGVDIRSAFTMDGGIRTEMAKAVKANVELITDIPTQYYQKLEKAVTESFTEGKRWEDMLNVIQHVAHVTESRAKLIARDQTSKMNGAFNRVRQTEAGITSYIWQTAGDERVRETHAENDGQEFEWDNPPEETGNPGDDINCRCVAIPVLKLEDEEDDS